MLIPFTAFGMQTISEQEMDNVTGQSGVAISLNDVMIYEELGGQELWYETTDPFAGEDAGSAAVGMIWDEGAATMMHVNAIMYDAGDEELYSPGRDLFGDYDEMDGGFEASAFMNTIDPDTGEYDLFTSSALTITVTDDVAIIGEALDNAYDLIGGERDVDVTGISIGLPTVEIYAEDGSWDIMQIAATTDAPNADDRSLSGSFGTLYTTDGGSVMSVLDGNLEIVPLDNYVEAQPSP